MSFLKAEKGQQVLLPKESHDFDNNAESDNSANTSSSEEQENGAFLPKHQRYTKLHPIIIKMLNFLKEIGLMLLVAFAYAALTNDPPKISKSPAAYPFFSKNSIVTDWYRGQISLAIEKARKSDIAFVMFYAPWDSKSQDIREEFEQTARYMQKLISFTAINCWQPGSECRLQYNKVYNWPVLIAYPAHGRGIQYNGAKTMPHMVAFLTAISNPLIRIEDASEISLLLAKYDAVVVAEVLALPGSFDYAVIYSTSLRFLEKDPYREVAFAVSTKLNPNESLRPTFKLYMWNETLVYPSSNEWKPDALLSWIFKHLHQVSMWLSPIGSKSQQLSTYMQPGPALILFTPRNPLFSFVDYYDMLRNVALNYHNCDNTKWLNKLQLLIRNKRFENHMKYKYLTSKCSKQPSPRFPSVVSFALPKKWSNNSCCSSNSKGNEDFCVSCDVTDCHTKQLPEKCKGMRICHQIYDASKTSIHSCREDGFKLERNLLKTSMLTGVHDPKSPQNLKSVFEEIECHLFNLANGIDQPIFSPSLESYPIDNLEVNFSGMACKPNRTLTFVAVDSLKYHHFAEGLGVDLHNQDHRTAMVLLNEKMETHFVLPGILRNEDIRKFVLKFTKNQLPRAFYSSSKKYNKTHVYAERHDCRRKGEFCVQELDSQTFLPTTMETNKAVVVLYYSKQCSFCNGISYSFLMTAKSFSSIENIKFARIDGDLNSLPWEYTMDNFPTILYFPSFRKSESRVFPINIPLTVPNLISFVLLNLEPSMKVHAMWSLCNNAKFEEETTLCTSAIRVEVLSLINRTLKQWRSANVRLRAELLYKLQQLRNLHLILAHSPNSRGYVQKYLKRLHKRPETNAITQKLKVDHDEL